MKTHDETKLNRHNRGGLLSTLHGFLHPSLITGDDVFLRSARHDQPDPPESLAGDGCTLGVGFARCCLPLDDHGQDYGQNDQDV